MRSDKQVKALINNFSFYIKLYNYQDKGPQIKIYHRSY